MNRYYLLALLPGILMVRPAYGTDTIIPFIGADAVHAQGIHGQGVTVAVLDDGIHSDHLGLQGSIADGGVTLMFGQPFPDGGEAESYDDHGTFVSLEITDPAGIAPAADILSLRVFSPWAYGEWDDLKEAITYARRRRLADPSIRIINMSLGGGAYTCPCDDDAPHTQELQAAISAAELSGILSFAASGNEAYCGYICAPACTTSAIPIAASYDGDYPSEDLGDCMDFDPQPHWIVCFSNLDNCDFFLAAPGYDVSVGGYEGWDGTSMATPVVSAVAALMWSKNGCGSLSASQVRNIIFGTALPYSWAYPYCSIWQPDHVNALAAVNAIPSGTTPGTGDLDCDGAVCGDDFRTLEGCFTGPGGGPVTSFCVAGDYPASPPDGDVDLADFARFQQDFTGYGEGACCHIDATCTEGPVTDCREEFYAFYQGHGTTCATTDCPVHPWGACCNVYTGECSIMAEDDCVWSDGTYQGDGTDCESTVCPVVRYDNKIDPLTTFINCPTGILADDATLHGSGGGYVRQYTVGLFGGYGGPFNATTSLHTGYPPTSGNRIAGTQFTYYNLPDSGSPVFVSPIVDPPVYIPHSVWIKVDLHGNSAAGWFRAEEAELGFTQDYYARYDPPWATYYWGGSPWAGFWATITCDAPQGDSPAITPSELTMQASEEVRMAEEPPSLHTPIDWKTAPLRSEPGPRAGSVSLELISPAAGLFVQPGELIEWSIIATASDTDNAGLALVSVDLVQNPGNPALFDLPPATVIGAGMEGFQRPTGIDNPEQGGTASAYVGTPIGTPGAMNLAQIGGAQNTFGVPGDEIGIDIDVDAGVGHTPQLIAEGAFYAPSTEGTYTFSLENGLANVLDSAPSPSDHWPVTAASVTLGEPLAFIVGEITCTPGDMNDDAMIDGLDIQPFIRVFLNPAEATAQSLCAADCDENNEISIQDTPIFIGLLLGG